MTMVCCGSGGAARALGRAGARSRTEQGSVLPLMVLAVLVVGVLALMVGRIGSAAADRARASSAADAAALAGVAGGEAEARRLADANGATLLRFEERGDDRRVTVRSGRAVAVARATRREGPERAAGRGSDPAPAMNAALGRAGQLLGRVVTPTSVAAEGLVVDLTPPDADALAKIGPKAGLCRPDPETSPHRFHLCPPDNPG